MPELKKSHHNGQGVGLRRSGNPARPLLSMCVQALVIPGNG